MSGAQSACSSPVAARASLMGAVAAGAAAASLLCLALSKRQQMKAHRRRWRVGEALPRPSSAGSCIYLDINATCPIYPDVADASAPYFRELWGNPSSSHAYGRPCRDAVQLARSQMAAMINAKAVEEVVFCGCGSEADNWALLGALEKQAPRRHIVTSSIEHPAILRCVEALEKAKRCEVTIVPCNEHGYVDPSQVAAAVVPGSTAVVSIMLANNEVGSIQDVKEMVRLCKEKDAGLLFHTDAAQACGKIDVDVESLGVDLCTIVGHKFGAPKGIAALFVRRSVGLPPMIRGGGQEGGKRAGTECVPLIVAMGEAAAIWSEQGKDITSHMEKLRDLLLAKLRSLVGADRVHLNGGLRAIHEGGPATAFPTLPNTLSVAISGGPAASQVLSALSEAVAASAGAACHSSSHGAISEVLAAMTVPESFARATLRLSVGRHTTQEEIEQAARLIAAQYIAKK